MSISEEELQECEIINEESRYPLSPLKIGRLIQEVRELRGAMFAQDERERRAAERLGMVHTCDWPDEVADRVQAAEHREKVAMRALGNVVSFVNGNTGEHADVDEALEQAGKELDSER